MTVSHVSIYCLANIRAPWVLVYEPHPWGCGALRVKESSAVLVYQRPASKFELEWLAEAICYHCVTFRTAEHLLAFEDGQHEQADQVREMIRLKRDQIAVVMAKVEKKQREKRAKERKRGLPVIDAGQ